MKIIYTFGLAAAVVFSQFLHAQGCSGGVDGGMVATGNQCNGPVSETAYKTMSVAVRPVELRGAEGVEVAGHARPLAVRPSKSPPPPYHATAFAIPVRHFAAIPATEPPSPKSAKIAGNADSDGILELGLAEYEIGHYAAAARQFRRAAEMGDARAPAMLALMYRFGERLYGNQIRANAAEAAYWADMAAERHSGSITKGVAATR